MIDFNSFPSNYYIASVISSTGEYATIAVPKWASLVKIFCCGSGGRGGTGNSKASGTAGGGGGGGGAGAAGYFIYPASFLGGGFSAEDNGAGVQCYLGRGKSQVFLNAGIGSNGSNGTSSGGVLGAEGAMLNYITQPLFTAPTTVAATAGGSNAASAAISTALLMPSTGGTGGGGGTSSNFAGGNITNTILSITIAGGAATAAGVSGIWLPEFRVGLGGTGGGSNVAGTGGRGGNGGGYGCGGGGGGAGVTGGAGGTGGPPRVDVWFA